MKASSTHQFGVRSVLERCLDRVAGEPGAAAIWRVWEEAVGPQIARRAQPIRLRGRTLLVAVSSAPWMQELQLLKRTILTELNARLPVRRPNGDEGTAFVGDLFFVITALEDGAVDARGVGDRPARRPRRDCPVAPAATDLAELPPELRATFDGIARAWRRRAGS